MTKVDFTTNRREFVKLASLTIGGGLTLGFSITGNCQENSLWQPSAWLQIAADNTITFILGRCEMGQDVYTSLAMILAEELEVDLDQINIQFAGVDRIFNHPELGVQVTGGSSSVRTSFQSLSQVGATARQMLIEAAANSMKVDASKLEAEGGFIIDRPSGKRISYGDLAALASRGKIPKDVALKNPASYRLIGKPQKRLDLQAKISGSAQFGIDVEMDGLCYASIIYAPHVGSLVEKFDDTKAKTIAGFHGAYQIKRGIAVVANSYWAVQKAAEQIEITWSKSSLEPMSDESILEDLRKASQDSGKSFESRTDKSTPDDAKPKEQIEAEYFVPYMAHATMEPMNCTAHVYQDKRNQTRCEVWAPTQAPDIAESVAATVANIDRSAVTIHQTFIGGGFGRRLSQDYVSDAVEISLKSRTKIKMIANRADDFAQDVFRPVSLHKLNAAFTADKNLLSWRHKIIAPSILAQVIPEWGPVSMPNWLPDLIKRSGASIASNAIRWTNSDDIAVEGATKLPYQIPNMDVSYVEHDPGIAVGFWRSVANSYNGFVTESFLDECAHSAGKDPLGFRLSLLPDDSPHRRVLQKVAALSNWHESRAAGRFLGIAQLRSFGSYVAQAAEIVIENQQIVVKNVWCVMDCGTVINPDGVRAQIEGSIIFALSACLYDKIEIKDGRIVQTNFDNFRVARCNQVPTLHIEIIKSGLPAQGVGEPAVPPLAAAVANAVFRATAIRLRSLPLRLKQ